MKGLKLYNLTKNFVFNLDAKGYIIGVNPDDAKPLGYSKKEFFQKPVQSILSINDQKKIKSIIQNLGLKQTTSIEAILVTKNNKPIWHNLAIVCNMVNNKREFLLHCNDIDELKNQLLKSQTIIQDLKKAYAINDQIIHSTQAIILRLNVDGTVESLSKGAERILGYKSNKLVNKNWYTQVVTPNKSRKYLNDFKAFVNSNKKTFNVVTPVICKDKSEKIISWKANKILVDKKVIGVITIGKEITEWHNKVSTLQQSEIRFRTLAELVQVPLAFISSDGKIAFINKAYTKEYGFQLHEIPNVETLLTLCYNNEKDRKEASNKWQKELETIKKKKILLSTTTSLFTKCGEQKFVKYSAVLSNDYIYYSYFDITIHIEKENILFESKEVFKRIAENTPVSIAGYDVKNLKVIFTNKKFINSIGYSFEEINKMKDWANLIFYNSLSEKKELDDEWEKVKIELISNPVSIIKNLERKITCKDGVTRDFEIAITFDRNTIYALFYDITERKRAQNQLLKSEMRFRNLAEEILFPVLFVNVDGKFIFVNKAFTQKFGYTLKDFPNVGTVVNKTKSNLNTKKSETYNWETEIKNLFANNNTITNSIDIETKRGEIRQVEYSASLSDDFVFYVYSDITEQRKAEQRLKLSEEKFRNIVEYLPIPLVSLNPVTGTLISNKKHQELIGYNNSTSNISNIQIEQFSNDNLIDKKSKKHFTTLINKIENNNSETPLMQPKYQLRVLCRDQQIRTFEVTENIYEKTLYTLFHDITDRLKATELLMESEQKFKALAENMPMAIGGYNSTNKVIFLNNYFTKITGYKIEDVPTIEDWYKKTQPIKNIRNAFYEHWMKIVADFRAKKTRKKPEVKATVLCKNGSYKYFSFSFSIYNDVTYILIIDITEAEKAKKELEKSHQELRNLASYLQNVREEERKSISREIHDELGQQLTGIKMDISAIRKKTVPDLPALNNDFNDVLEMLNASVQTIRVISSQLRPSVLDDLGLSAAIEWQTKEFSKRANLICKFSNQIEDALLTPEIQLNLFRILQEALTNVLRHAGAKNVTIRLYKSLKKVNLQIKDDGVGFNTNNQSKTLGLLGMKERVLMLSGTFKLVSKQNTGTSLLITIPIK
jgi:PAS domain S-box-containing protein